MFIHSFVRHEISSSNISKSVWPWITKFYTVIHTDIVYSYTGYDVIVYFRSEVIGEKQSKIPSPPAPGGISQERFKLGAWNCTHLSMTAVLINVTEALKWRHRLLTVGIWNLSRFEKCRIRRLICVMYNAVLHYAVSKASSNFARKEYRQRLRLKLRGVSPIPPYGGLLVCY